MALYRYLFGLSSQWPDKAGFTVPLASHYSGLIRQVLLSCWPRITVG